MSIRSKIKKLINSIGYDIRPLDAPPTRARPKIRTTIEQSYCHIRELGFQPNTIIDIGVAAGTPELYRTFPDSYFLLVEPLKEFEPDLKSILEHYRGSYILAAAGASPGQVAINVHDHQLAGSTLYKEAMGIEADGHETFVPLIKIDDAIEKQRLSGPYLIKVDVQGAELDALDGSRHTLIDAEVVVLEVSLFMFWNGAPQLHDVVAYMKNLGFVAYDIILGWNRPLDNALGQIDIVFVKDEGMFRQEHSYSTINYMNSKFNS